MSIPADEMTVGMEVRAPTASPTAVPGDYQLGQIVASSQVEPSTLGLSLQLRPAGIHEVKVVDPYVEHYPRSEQLRIKAEESYFAAQAEERHDAGLWHRRPDTVYFDPDGQQQEKRTWGDPATKQRYLDAIDSPGVKTWTTLIPSSRALTFPAGPHAAGAIAGADGSVLLDIDDNARIWWSLATDPIGIRSRASVMAWAIKAFVDERFTTPASRVGLRWMSVACGTALPAMTAAIHAGLHPELLLVDLDRSAMSSTQELAEQIGFQGAVTQHRVNIFAPRRLAQLGEQLNHSGGRPQFLDLMGIFEYTGRDLGVDPVAFLQANWELLAPGGRLVFGQMRADRPVATFFTGVLGWPLVQMRTPTEFLQIIHDAGIPVGAAELYLPSDGVYMVGVIDKPGAEQPEIIDLRDSATVTDGLR
jgi:hypothetical protein